MPLRCLIVDDNDAFLASATRLLEAQGLHVVGLASSGAEAARVAPELRPDVALVDMELDGETGLEVAQLLASAQPPMTTILMSAYPEEELADLVAASSAAGFIPKSRLSAAAIRQLIG
jgi:two-component system nitrate/nitrite response regulator NarL